MENNETNQSIIQILLQVMFSLFLIGVMVLSQAYVWGFIGDIFNNLLIKDIVENKLSFTDLTTISLIVLILKNPLNKRINDDKNIFIDILTPLFYLGLGYIHYLIINI